MSPTYRFEPRESCYPSRQTRKSSPCSSSCPAVPRTGPGPCKTQKPRHAQYPGHTTESFAQEIRMPAFTLVRVSCVTARSCRAHGVGPIGHVLPKIWAQPALGVLHRPRVRGGAVRTGRRSPRNKTSPRTFLSAPSLPYPAYPTTVPSLL